MLNVVYFTKSQTVGLTDGPSVKCGCPYLRRGNMRKNTADNICGCYG